jgi:hypothetical protein
VELTDERLPFLPALTAAWTPLSPDLTPPEARGVQATQRHDPCD